MRILIFMYMKQCQFISNFHIHIRGEFFYLLDAFALENSMILKSITMETNAEILLSVMTK